MATPGVQSRETVFKAVNVSGEAGWRKRNVELRVIGILLLMNRERGGKRSER